MKWANPSLPSDAVRTRRKNGRPPRNALGLDSEISWAIHSMASELGMHGTWSSVENAALSGGQHLGAIDASEAQMRRRAHSAARASRFFSRWKLLTQHERRILEVHHSHVSGSGLWLQKIFGIVAAVAVYLEPNPKQLLVACEKRDPIPIDRARKRAVREVTAANASWFETERKLADEALEATG